MKHLRFWTVYADNVSYKVRKSISQWFSGGSEEVKKKKTDHTTVQRFLQDLQSVSQLINGKMGS